MNDPVGASEPDAIFSQAVGWHKGGRLAEAEEGYRLVLARSPGHAGALQMLGVLAVQSGRTESGVQLLRQAVAAAPDSSDAWYNLGNGLKASDRLDEAIDAYRHAVKADSKSARAHYNLANALKAAGRADEAVLEYQQTLDAQPDHIKALNNLGALLFEANRFDEAMDAYGRALKIRPDFADAHNGLGNIYRARCEWEAAERAYRAALRFNADPASPPHGTLCNLAMVLLVQGRNEEGFDLYDARLELPEGKLAPELSRFRWDGSPLAGRRLLIHAEQGLGDTIQFVRYVPQVIAAGGRVVMLCQSELRRLVERTPGIEELSVPGEPLPAFDVFCPIMSLPRVFGAPPDGIPATVPYLGADPSQIERWRERLSPHRGQLNVGLVWSGSTAFKGNRSRCPSADALAPLTAAAKRGVRFVSLQKGKPLRNPPPGLEMIDWTGELHDLADTAALVENLDLVISVDTSVAHLVGAMGKPGWVLLSNPADWRWLLDRNDSPWYPSLRLFRQPRPGDWQTPISQILEQLLGLVSSVSTSE